MCFFATSCLLMACTSRSNSGELLLFHRANFVRTFSASSKRPFVRSHRTLSGMKLNRKRSLYKLFDLLMILYNSFRNSYTTIPRLTLWTFLVHSGIRGGGIVCQQILKVFVKISQIGSFQNLS